MIIQVDTASLVENFYITPDQEGELLDFTAKELTNRFAAAWENEANRTLKSGRQQYINGIVVVDEGFAKGAVMLVGKFPNMFEEGVDEFDLKEGLLNGPNAKTSESGSRYNTVPFSHGTPGALASNFNGGVMPSEIHNIIKKEPVSNITNKSRPLVKDDLPKPFQQPITKSLKNNQTYTHKNAIYEGLRKEKDAKTGQNTYTSFRRVSDNSDVNSWQHPGFEARDLAGKALEEFDVPAQISAAFDKWWANK